MDLKDLRCLSAIAETGSFFHASRILHVSQPSISARMRDLELRLGLTLFERLPRGVRLTHEGTELLEHARSIIQQFEEAGASMQAYRQSPAGLVRLGLPTSLTPILAGPILDRCMSRFPDVKLRIVESMTGYIVNWLREDKLDLAVVFGSAVPGIVATPLVEEDLLCAGSDDRAMSRLRNKDGEVPFESLGGLPLILPGPEHGLRMLIERQAKQQGVRLNVIVEIDAFGEIQRLVSSGLGYTLLSSAAVLGYFTSRLCTARVVDPAISRVVNLAHSAARPLARASREVRTEIEKILRQSTTETHWMSRAL